MNLCMTGVIFIISVITEINGGSRIFSENNFTASVVTERRALLLFRPGGRAFFQECGDSFAGFVGIAGGEMEGERAIQIGRDWRGPQFREKFFFIRESVGGPLKPKTRDALCFPRKGRFCL